MGPKLAMTIVTQFIASGDIAKKILYTIDSLSF